MRKRDGKMRDWPALRTCSSGGPGPRFSSVRSYLATSTGRIYQINPMTHRAFIEAADLSSYHQDES
jgi:hypothetical protein